MVKENSHGAVELVVLRVISACATGTTFFRDLLAEDLKTPAEQRWRVKFEQIELAWERLARHRGLKIRESAQPKMSLARIERSNEGGGALLVPRMMLVRFKVQRTELKALNSPLNPLPSTRSQSEFSIDYYRKGIETTFCSRTEGIRGIGMIRNGITHGKNIVVDNVSLVDTYLVHRSHVTTSDSQPANMCTWARKHFEG
ncbi:hypothetical protein F5146DRAFT_1006436 [Armillaria mellea]|nr:hypothetical protein F5146DRAFT_1006436 [Armillaria mellea]